MYIILFNGNLLRDHLLRPERFNKKDAAEKRAKELRKDNPQYKVEVIKRMVSLNQVV